MSTKNIVCQFILCWILVFTAPYAMGLNPSKISDEKEKNIQNNQMSFGSTILSELEFLSKLNSYTDENLRKSIQLTETMLSSPQQHQTPVPLFGKICIKNGEKGVLAYLSLRKKYFGSADEEFSYVIEQLFFLYPNTVLEFSRTLNSKDRENILFDIAWGFLGNHRTYSETPINLSNFKHKFFDSNQMYFELNKKFPEEFEFIMNSIELELSH